MSQPVHSRAYAARARRMPRPSVTRWTCAKAVLRYPQHARMLVAESRFLDMPKTIHMVPMPNVKTSINTKYIIIKNFCNLVRNI